jgi:hypothetical protein
VGSKAVGAWTAEKRVDMVGSPGMGGDCSQTEGGRSRLQGAQIRGGRVDKEGEKIRADKVECRIWNWQLALRVRTKRKEKKKIRRGRATRAVENEMSS